MKCSSPVSKQTKMSDYFSKEEDEEEEIILYNVPLSNQFSPLANCPDSLLPTEKPLGSVCSSTQGSERQTNNIPLELPIAQNFAILMAKTVNLISKLRKDIISCINLLSLIQSQFLFQYFF